MAQLMVFLKEHPRLRLECGARIPPQSAERLRSQLGPVSDMARLQKNMRANKLVWVARQVRTAMSWLLDFLHRHAAAALCFRRLGITAVGSSDWFGASEMHFANATLQVARTDSETVGFQSRPTLEHF